MVVIHGNIHWILHLLLNILYYFYHFIFIYYIIILSNEFINIMGRKVSKYIDNIKKSLKDEILYKILSI